MNAPSPIPNISQCPPPGPQEVREEERYLLEEPNRSVLAGPRGRWHELGVIIRSGLDLLRGFRILHFVGPCVTVFGSARVPAGHRYYELTREVAGEIARLGFTVMTGGGPGLMEAANRGAKEAGGKSIGCNIQLPHEQHPNAWLDRSVTLRYFFTRKVVLVKYSYAFIVMPGGLGTMDELFEALTLIQTGKMKNFPVILMGSDYWRPLLGFLDDMVTHGVISKADLDLLVVTDDVSAVMNVLCEKAITQFGLHQVKMPKRRRWLGEG